MRKFVPLALALLAAWFFIPARQDPGVAAATDNAAPEIRMPAPVFVAGAQVSGVGTVDRLLADDNSGSRHQRFIIRMDSGRTLLVAHNIDLAPRIEALRPGDRVEFNGEFEPNAQGGVIHWTHHDPQGSHEGGWLKHSGRTYQ